MSDVQSPGDRAPDRSGEPPGLEAMAGSPPQLHDVLETVSAAARLLIPFDRIGIALLEGPERVRFSVTGDGGDGLAEQFRFRRQCSDQLWPRSAETAVCVRDARHELDPSHDVDRRAVEDGCRSILVLSLELHGRQLGVLWFDARQPEAFDQGHAAAAKPVANLLALALEQQQLWRLEQERRRKRDQLHQLLPTIADALDIRAVFPRMSALLQDVIPHVTTSLVLLTPDRGGVKVHTALNYEISELPEYRFTSPNETITAGWRSFVGYDCEFVGDGVVRVRISRMNEAPAFVELRPAAPFSQLAAGFKLRSFVRVPLRIREQPVGAIAFGSDRPDAYGDDDVDLATRIADHIALALAHEQLAEEARRAGQAQERAAMLQDRVDTLVRELEHGRGHRALGESRAWKDALVQAAWVADTETTVLITGESGTGKEVIARFIHQASKRARGPFVAMNCAALPEQLLESELFGFERGAFTGAHVSRSGKMEQAAGGVLFLDEVGEMAPAVQAKFLRVLQEREFQRLGGHKTLKADVRVIAATNRDPAVAIERGTLREDLYYRLGVFEITLPPLRERGDDIVLLAEAFLDEVCLGMGRPATGISEDARDQLIAHTWPGNVRELRNAIERAVIMGGGGLVSSEHLPIAIGRAQRTVPLATPSRSGQPAAAAEFPASGINLEAVERDLVTKALAHAGNNKSQAAKLLGLPRGQFYSLLRRHGLTVARR